MLQNIGVPFLKREKKLENIICKYLNIIIHLCIYKSSVHILVSSCYNSYGVLETSRNSWGHKNQLLVSRLEILHGFNLACWFQMLAPYPLLPSILQEIVRCFSFSYVFLRHKNSVRHVSESHSSVEPNWREASLQKNRPCPCPFRILDPTIFLSLTHNKIHRTQYVLPAIEVGRTIFDATKKNINKLRSAAAAYIHHSFNMEFHVWNLKPSSTISSQRAPHKSWTTTLPKVGRVKKPGNQKSREKFPTVRLDVWTKPCKFMGETTVWMYEYPHYL